MTTIPVNPSTIGAALLAAQSGDILSLAAGDYVNFRKPKADVTLTLEAADLDNRPRFYGTFTLDNWRNTTFKNLKFDVSNATAHHIVAVLFYGGQNLVFDGCQWVGKLATGNVRWGYGFKATNVTGLTIKNSKLSTLSRGGVVSDTSNFTLTGNDFTDIGSDGLDLGPNVNGAFIAYNMWDGFSPVTGDHPDGIQIMTNAAGKGCTDIIIRENAIRCSTGPIRAQGIFCTAQNMSAYGRHTNVQVIDNLLINTGWNGISVVHGDNFVASDNRLMFDIVTENVVKYGRLIMDDCTNGTVSRNAIMGGYVLGAGVVSINNTQPGETTAAEQQAALDAWIAKYRATPDPDPTPEPPPPPDAGPKKAKHNKNRDLTP